MQSLAEHPYVTFHALRYELLLEKVRELAPDSPRVLDVGPSYEVAALRTLPAVVDTLGLRDDRFPARGEERHLEFDLQDAVREELWPKLDDYDLVVCAEVIEHLPISPVHVLRLLGTALRPSGWLVLQTPNAARIRNRVRLLMGHNPFDPLREGGHVREYTIGELLSMARDAGLDVGGWLTADYFVTGSLPNAVVRRLSPIVPPSLRAGITAWFRRP